MPSGGAGRGRQCRRRGGDSRDTARHRAGTAAQHLVVVFTDGEELGLLGAQLFATAHPRAARLGLVLNFEGRGNAGPSYLFQTSPGNEALIRGVARAAPHPRTNSLTGEVYRRLPNDTDLTIFLRELPGVAALNFAFIDGFDAYPLPRTPRPR